ncbi:hypothetical protein HGA91_04220 [candidate division WWE3 bacterium]|nr:hypothetical protein [candidate division WWE3 bacterium]
MNVISTVIRDFFTVFVILQLLFGYLEYRHTPDFIYIVGRLFSSKYLVPSLIIPIAYIILKALLNFLFA